MQTYDCDLAVEHVPITQEAFDTVKSWCEQFIEEGYLGNLLDTLRDSPAAWHRHHCDWIEEETPPVADLLHFVRDGGGLNLNAYIVRGDDAPLMMAQLSVSLLLVAGANRLTARRLSFAVGESTDSTSPLPIKEGGLRLAAYMAGRDVRTITEATWDALESA